MSKNGVVVVERLETSLRSLKRSVEAVQRELDHREEYEDYKDTYASELSGLVSKTAALEDEIHRKLNYA